MRWLVSWLAALVVIVLPATGAAAHAGLQFSNPEDGAVLDLAPEEVVLTFSEELLTELVEVSVLDADDNPVVVTEVPQTPPPGTDVKVPWPADLPPGEYSVAYRVVSADGHPVTGRVTFSYANSREVAAEPTEQEPTPEPSPEPSVESGETPDSQPTAELEAATPEQISEEVVAVDEPNQSLIGPLFIAAAIIVGIGVVVSIVMLARSRQ